MTFSLSAHAAVAKAVRHKQLIKPTELTCVDCGAQAKCYDHRDYLKPLDVEPVCISCNAKRGPALNGRSAQEVKRLPKRDGLTERQLQILNYMVQYFEDNDQLPSHMATQEHFGWASANAAYEHFQALERAGYIERNACNKYRFARKARAADKQPA